MFDDDEDLEEIHPSGRKFWRWFPRRPNGPLDPETLRRLGVEYVTTKPRWREIASRYGLPNAVDVGHGAFGNRSGRLYIDDDTGCAVAYVPPEVET